MREVRSKRTKILQSRICGDTKNDLTNPLKHTPMPMPKPKVSLHSTTDPRDITKVLSDIHAENCFDTDETIIYGL